MNSARPRVVIIGGGFAGLEAAKLLTRTPADIIIIDRENHHLFQPLLYQVATAALAPSDITTPIRRVLHRASNTRVLLSEVTEIRTDDKQVQLIDGTVFDFDYLILAAGSQNNYFGNYSWRKHAHPLKTVRDAIDIRERILLAFEAAEQERDPANQQALLSFIVIGGGPTGVEMAGAIADLTKRTLVRDYKTIRKENIRVALIEMGDRILHPFPESLSACAKADLEELGVEVWLDCKVLDVQEAGVKTSQGWMPAEIVVWASGVHAASLSQTLGVTCDRGWEDKSRPVLRRARSSQHIRDR